MNLTEVRREFPVTENLIYLNHAAVAPLPRSAGRRMADLAEVVVTSGDRHWPERNDECERVRGLAARLLGARRDHEVAFVQNTADGLSLVAEGLDWRAGDNVVGAACEFPSNLYPWMHLADRGVEYRRIEERSGRLDEDELLSLVDDRTRAVALSWVQYASGYRVDLERIGRFCRERGVLFVVDAIQGLGALRLDVETAAIDVCAAATHKWLLGPEGLGLLYVSDRVVEQLRPRRVGWRSTTGRYDWDRPRLELAPGALRFEAGTLNVYGIAACGASLELLLAAPPAEVEERVLALADRVGEGLAALGFAVLGRTGPHAASGIVAAVVPAGGRTAGDLVAALAERGIVVSDRAGRFRVSAHFYNREEEVDGLLSALRDLGERTGRAGSIFR